MEPAHSPVVGSAPKAVPSEAKGAHTERLQSLDAFRGLTMFWLMGGKAFVIALAGLAGLDFVRYQLNHSEWEGLRYYDLIWPCFMLMVGMAVPFAYARQAATLTRGQIVAGAWKRAGVLFLLGSLRESLSDGTPRLVELSSALQPIAVAYLVAVHVADRKVRVQLALTAGIFVGYAALLACVPAMGHPGGSYVANRNIVTAVDLSVLGRAHRDGWGTVLSTIPTVATTLVGLMLGQVLRLPGSSLRKMRVIGLTGLGCLLAGYALSPVIPIVMKLWTTSYGLVVTGWACLLFLVFYWTIDVAGSRRWAFPLVVIGVNALAAYMLPTVVSLSRIVGTFTKPMAAAIGAFGPVLSTGALFVAGWLILFWMYRRKLFLRA